MNTYVLAIIGLSTILLISSSEVSVQESYNIPSWIKKNAKWWSEGQVQDSDFTKGIEYLIQQGIMKIPQTTSTSTTSHGIQFG
jgi:hypothetical protein